MTLRAIAALLGFFLAICALIAVVFAGMDERTATPTLPRSYHPADDVRLAGLSAAGAAALLIASRRSS
ncbi:MAG TPA: hypothetical protein VKU62_01505 [Thermoanaerobaculia bacterium]|nr:hypothetical protein [Thermoanaerobaculia bacterium]